MAKQKRVTVLECQYDQGCNLIIWTLQPIGEEPVKIGFRATDLGPAFGIKNDIPPAVIEKFCQEITGKEINWVIEVDQQPVSMKGMSSEMMWDKAYALNQYPLTEIAVHEGKR